MSPAARLVVLFASAGHFWHHVLTGLFLTLAVLLEGIWRRPYAEIISLWTAGAILIGLGLFVVLVALSYARTRKAVETTA